jgi:hypothetical protein
MLAPTFPAGTDGDELDEHAPTHAIAHAHEIERAFIVFSSPVR